MIKNDIKILRPFGPTIAKVEIPKEILEKLNSWCEKKILNHDELSKLNIGSKLAGNVTQEFMLDSDIIKASGFLNFLLSACMKWLELTENKKISKFNVLSSWIVRQFKNEYNPIHYHSGHISGVGYLKVPKDFGPTIQKNKTNLNGNICFIHGSRNFNCLSNFEVKPKLGDFYIFPNYMMHTVYPFYKDSEERRSISFNAVVDENIYDPYSN